MDANQKMELVKEYARLHRIYQQDERQLSEMKKEQMAGILKQLRMTKRDILQEAERYEIH